MRLSLQVHAVLPHPQDVSNWRDRTLLSLMLGPSPLSPFLFFFLPFPSCPYMKPHIRRSELWNEKKKNVPKMIVCLGPSLALLSICAHSCERVPEGMLRCHPPSLRDSVSHWLEHQESACPLSSKHCNYKHGCLAILLWVH